ncbi:60S ribosomal protein L7 [Clavispora lusitaniae]|nr:60S ribosomal protein L7 [Clavispora lusitaniae]
MFSTLTPETHIKKAKTDAKTIEKREAEKAVRKAANKEKRIAIAERTAAYNKEYRDAERAVIEAKREAKANNSYYVEAEPKLVFVIRIKGINKMAPKPRKVLQLLRLTQINAGVFVKVTKATSELLKLAEPYIAYGYPNLATVRKLIYKRGFGKVNNQRIALSDNQIIEAALGKYGIVSMEDLIHRDLSSVQTSSKSTTSCGHSTCPTLTVVSELESSSTSSKVVTSVTENSSSTTW